MRFKKLIVLPLVALSFCIGGCEASKSGSVTKKNNNGLVEPDGLIYLTVNGSTDLIIGDIQSGKYDYGHEFTFKIESVTDVTFYAYLNNERLEPATYDEFYRGIYEFKLQGNSTLTISSNKFYVDRTYTLKEIFPSVINKPGHTVSKVIIQSGTYGTEVDNVSTIESTDVEDINYNVDVYLNEPFVKNDSFVEPNGGGYTILKFVIDDNNAFDVNLSYDIPCYRDFSSYQYFKYANKSPRKPKILYPNDAGV